MAGVDIGTNAAGGCLVEIMKEVKKQARYCYAFSDFVKDLGDEHEELEAKRDDMQRQFDRDKASGKEPLRDSKLQLKKADELVKKVEELKKKAEAMRSCCPHGVRPNWICWYFIGRKAEKRTEAMKVLNGKLRQINVLSAHRLSLRARPLSGDFIYFECTRKAHDEVLKALGDDEKIRIGLCGMGGCGKTSLLKKVQKEMDDSKRYKTAFVVVSNPPNYIAIQDSIASWIGWKFETQMNVEDRAESLCMAFQRDKKYLIILDNVWQRLDFQVLGIPVGGNCKVLLSSRKLHIFDWMEFDAKIDLGILTKEEAWELFQKLSGKIQDSLLNGVAQEIADECYGLPVAIKAMAKALRCKEDHVWENARKKLKRPEERLNIDEEGLEDLYKCLKYSFDELKDPEEVSLYLLCALFPNDSEISIEVLIRFAFGLGIFKDVNSYERARDKVPRTINKFKNNCLLLPEGAHVKLHDMFHALALRETKKKTQVIMGPKQIEDLTKEVHMKDTNRLYCHGIEKFPDQLNCPDLEILIVTNNGGCSSKFPHKFFIEMQLKVLAIENTCSGAKPDLVLPELMEGLKKLRALCLRGWTLIGISMFENLTMLDTLELFDCAMEELPKVNTVKLLEVSNCKLEGDPYKVLATCSHLEELYFVCNNFPEMGQLQIGDNVVKFFQLIGSFNALQRYHLGIGGSINTSKYHPSSKLISNNDFDASSITNEAFQALSQTLEVLFLEKLKGDCNNIIPDLFPIQDECLKELKEFVIGNSDCIKCLIDTTSDQLHQTGTLFAKLQKLKVEAMKCLEALCHGPPPSDLFINLKELFIKDCTRLESLCTTTIAQKMVMLEVLEVTNCDSLRCMIKVENEDEANSVGSALPRLKQISVKRCKTLKFLLPISFSSGPLRLETLEIEDAAELQFVFGFDYNKKDKKQKLIDLSDLKIKLISLPKVSNICPKNYILKPPLDKPVVTGCPLLGDIFDIDSRVRQQEGAEAIEQVDLQSLVSGEEQRFSIATARHALSLCQFNAFVAELIEEKDLLMSRLEGLGPHQMSKYGDEERNLIEEVKDLECIAEKSRSCCNGVFPNWLGRYNVGKRVERMTKRVKQFNKRFTVVSQPMIGQRIDEIMVGSRKGPRDEILAALEDDETNMIGLCGMGGSGKTHLIKQLCTEVHSLKLFDTIVFVVVSPEPNITRMQFQIAEWLDLRFELEQSDQERAITLAKRLANGGKILIILDDMWEVLKLGDIGIPLSKNCKVVLTTRHRHLCTMMGCQRTVYLSVLSEEEAWNLFQRYADVEDEFEHLAQQIVKECRGLPLAIVTMAKTLRGRNVSVWKDTLMRLRNDEMTNASTDLSNVRDIIKLSIDHLEDDEAISLFYLCALFPEDSDIALEILIRFAFGLCIFKEVDSYETARIKVRAIIRKLIATNLLISEDENGNYLQMHDLVRDVSLDLSKKIQVSTGPRMNLQALTVRDYMEDTARLYCHDINEYPNQLNCPKLEFLFISNDGRFSSNFSDVFFFEMIELKVLTIINTSIVTTPHLLLPQSMETLEKLRTVCLRGWTLNSISILGKVGVLDTVELLFCVIMKLPEELADLKRLRLLEVSGCKIEGNPFEVLAKCFYLEELYFVENSLPELASNDFGVVKFLHQISSLKALQRYHLEIGRSIDTMENDLITKFISINGFNILSSNNEMKNMARELEVIFLANVQGDCRNIFPDMFPVDEECMNKLTELLLQGSDNMECFIDATCHPIYRPTTVFSKLLKLKIRTMKCFKALCQGPPPFNLFEKLEELFVVECCQLQCIVSMGELNFCNLKQLQLEDCPKLISVLTYSTAQTLVLLEILKVQDCVSLRQIIKDEEDVEITPAGPIFPKLRKVYIRGCPQLQFIVPASFLGGLPQLSIISDLDTKVEVQQGGGKFKQQELELPEIQSSDMVVQSAEDILVEECKIERIFQLTESTIDIESNSLSLSCLQRLVVENLPNLRYIHEGHKQLFNLRRLKIYKCGELKCIFSLRLMAYISALQELIIEDCSLLEQIIDHDYDDSQYIDTVSGPYHDNNNLQKITVKSCPKLGSLFTVSTAKTLKMMRTLKIEECPGMKFLLKDESVEAYKKKETIEEEDGQDIFQNLSFLSLKNLPELIHVCEGEMFETVQGVMFPESFNLYNLQSLTVKSCPKLRSLFTVSTAVTLMWLTSLVIIDSSSLEYVIEGKSKGITVGKTKEMLPRLKILHLVKLPRLIIIHRGIKLQCELCHIHDCPMLEQTFADVVKPDDLLQERKEVDKATDGNQSVDSLLPTIDSGSSEVVSFHQGKQARPSGSNTAEAAEAHSHARELEIVDDVEGLQEQNSVNSMNSREVFIGKKPQIVTDPQQAHQQDKASLPLAGQSELLSPSRINTATASSTSEALDSSSKQKHQMSSSEIVKSLQKNPGPEESTLGSSSQIKVEKPSTMHSPSTRITTILPAAEELTPSSLDQHPQKEELVDFHGLFKIKARQAGLLEEAFLKYSHLLEWKLSQKTPRICKVGYKSLADMLAFLKSETPKTMDDSKMEKFESLCYELKYFGFDKMWLTSIRQKVMDMQADHKNKLKQVDQLKSQIGALEEQLSDARASLTTANNDLSKPGHVFDF